MTADQIALGRSIRAARVRLRLRQSDVAERAAVHRAAISAIENGRAGECRMAELDRVAAAVHLRLRVALVTARGDVSRLGDEAHAALVERLARLLRLRGWEAALEATASSGSIDVLAYHSGSRHLAVFEVKSRIVDLQETLRIIHGHERSADRAARQLGWVAAEISTILVVADTSTQRRIAARHRATLGAALPDRSVAINGWLRRPDRRLRGLKFLSYAGRRDVIHATAIRVRPSAVETERSRRRTSVRRALQADPAGPEVASPGTSPG